MDPIFQQVLANVVASGPVAGILFYMWWTKRKDCREERIAHAAEMQAERDRHAVEEQKMRAEYVALADKVISATKGESS